MMTSCTLVSSTAIEDDVSRCGPAHRCSDRFISTELGLFESGTVRRTIFGRPSTTRTMDLSEKSTRSPSILPLVDNLPKVSSRCRWIECHSDRVPRSNLKVAVSRPFLHVSAEIYLTTSLLLALFTYTFHLFPTILK